jgi:hypothetical protein
MVANYLDADRDIASFSRTCRATRGAVHGDGLSYWRVKFREKYAYKKATSNKTLKRKYQSRQQVLREGTGVYFLHGHSEGEQKVVAVLKDLINGELVSCQSRYSVLTQFRILPRSRGVQ